MNGLARIFRRSISSAVDLLSPRGPLVVEMSGGLGNQLFQWAFAEAISRRFGLEKYFAVGSYFDASHPESRELHITEWLPDAKLLVTPMEGTAGRGFEIGHITKQDAEGSRRSSKPSFDVVVVEQERDYGRFHPNYVSALRRGGLARGYFQDERYFQSIEGYIRATLARRTALSLLEFTRQHRELLAARPIAVQVRRGDFFRSEEIAEIHGLLNPDYFFRSIAEMRERLGDRTIWFFSDDPAFCGKVFGSVANSFVVSPPFIPSNPFLNLSLLSACDAHIISNSTFGWWGAYLSGSHNVIAPRIWAGGRLTGTHGGIVPERWATRG